MRIEKTRFCVNRKTAPSLDIESFFQTVHKTGLNKIELRNDLADPSITGGKSTGEIVALCEKYGIEIVTINALYPFNLPAARQELTRKAEEMLSIARDVNCKAVILCPYNEPDTRTETQKDTDCVDSLQYFAELFGKYGIHGLIEPLGFPISSLRSFLKAQELIKKSGTSFTMTVDTFHYHLSGIATQDFNAGIDVNMIGLVHLSGVEDTRPTDQLTDEERIMLTEKDVLRTKAQVENLEKLGYKGVYAFEPFASSLNGWDSDMVARQVLDSIAMLQQ